MSISINANQAGKITGSTNYSVSNSGQQEKRKMFFVGNSALENDPIAERRALAQKKALKVVQDAWKTDKAVSDSIEERRTHYSQMLAAKESAQRETEALEAEERALQEQYGVADDSAEQQDLELLKRQQDLKNGVSHERLSAEEREKASELMAQGLTEYQTRALELNDRAACFKKTVKDSVTAMKDDVSDIKSILSEKLKSNPMLDAQEAAEEIWAAANDDILRIALQEAVDHIEEERKEQEEKAEENTKEQEEKEEQLEDLKEKRAIEQALIEGTEEAAERAKEEHQQNENPDIRIDELLDITQLSRQSSEVSSSLADIKSSMNLLEADLMGIKVDEEV